MPHSNIQQVGLTVVLFVGLFDAARSTAQPPPPPPMPAPFTACATAIDCGLSPKAIVVADASDSTTALLARLESDVALRTLLAQHHASLSEARANLAALSLQPTIDTTGTALEEAQAQVDAAKAALEATRLEVFETATEGFTETVLLRFSSWRNSVGFNVPAEFRARNHNEAEWRIIEGALRAERRAVRRDETLPADVSTLLTNIRADIEVIAAASRLSQQIATVEAQFEACANASTQ